MIKKNDIIELEITDFGNDGEGVGRYDGMTFFVKGAVIGDIIRAGVMKLKKTYGYARLVEIIKESGDRVDAACPVAQRCGGCRLMNLNYGAQLKYKEDKIISCITRLGGVRGERLVRADSAAGNGISAGTTSVETDGGKSDTGKQPDTVELFPIIGASSPLRYRNKAQLPVGTDPDGNIVTGFYAGHSHTIIDCEDCLLQPEIDAAIICTVKRFMKENGIGAYNEETGEGLIRHVLTRVGFHTGEIMVCIIINGDVIPRVEKLAKMLEDTVNSENEKKSMGTNLNEDASLKGAPNLCLKSVSVNINKENTNVIMGPKGYTVFGGDYITDCIGDLKFRISPLSFFQVNPEQTGRLYAQALEFAGLTGNETVWDLYCGTGTISLFLARNAKKVYGVEIVPEAIADANENAKDNGIKNAEFFVGAAEEVLPAMLKKDPSMRADVIVLDPPRKGCDEKLLASVITMLPNRVVYVSCDPATLARDIKYFEEHDYILKKVRGCDMFPNTSHVETVVCMSKKNSKPKDYVEIGVDAEDYYKIKEGK